MMEAKKKYGAFISYSSEDELHITFIIELIRAMRADLVFQDRRNIKPGKLWEPQLLKALDEAKIIIVFWCRHSANSIYVRKEYEFAIEKNKDVLPLLLDETELINSLTSYQWIDCRKAHLEGHYETEPYPVPFKLLKQTRKLLNILIYSTLLFLVGHIIFNSVVLLSSYFSSEHKPESTRGSITGIIIAIVILIFCILFLFRGKKKERGRWRNFILLIEAILQRKL